MMMEDTENGSIVLMNEPKFHCNAKKDFFMHCRNKTLKDERASFFRHEEE